MREILYRARRCDNGEWIYGTPYQEYDTFWCEWEWKIQTKHPLTNVPYMHLTVDSKTISQFTGLLDKNGKKIFEGDIVSIDGRKCHQRSVIKYDTGALYVDFCQWEGRPKIKAPLYDFTNNIEFEIIGNIYDNPELLV